MRGSASRGINRGSITFTRPVFPSPAPPGWNRRRFGFPPSFAPRRHRQHTSGAGTGHRARTWSDAYDISRTSDLACSLNACDLASHGEWEVHADARAETRFHFRTSIASVVPWLVVSGSSSERGNPGGDIVTP